VTAPQFDGTQVCAQIDPEIFFPEVGGRTTAARRICSDCRFREPCLDYALEWIVAGVWGGTTSYERRGIRRARGVVGKPLPLSDLTKTNDRAVGLMAAGMTTAQIETRLGVSRRTAERMVRAYREGQAAS
jgi:WhiB family redox-sensing transcriptional regulator